MISELTVIYAALALMGGGLGARLCAARVSSGLFAAGAGFIASCAAQLAGLAGPIDFAAFVIVAGGLGYALKLRPLQILAVVAGAILASFIGGFLIGLGISLERGVGRPGG